MTTLIRRGFASTFLGAAALFFVGCGGGGSGPSPVNTPTPGGTPNGTVIPAPVPVGDGRSVAAGDVVFVSNRANPSSSISDLYKLRTDGTVIRLTNLGKVVDNPSVSSDGSRIVFQFEDSYTADNGQTYTDTEIALIRADGGKLGNGEILQQLTSDTDTKYAFNRPDDNKPTFSPGDSYIYWTSLRGGTRHIWRMSGASGGEGANQVQFINQESSYPSVDNNGNIAYLDYTVANSPIAISNSSGQLIKRIPTPDITNTTGDARVFDVALSPDGNRVAFSVIPGEGSVDPAKLRVYNTVSFERVGTAPEGSYRYLGGAWRDSNTLFFSAVSGTRQIFSTTATTNPAFSTQTQLTNGVGDNYSPALLPSR